MTDGSAQQVTGKTKGEVDRLPLGLVERVWLWSLIVWAAGIAGAWVAGWRAAAGMGLGGAVSVGLLSLHSALGKAWLKPSPRRSRALVLLWAVWLLKWPALGVLLYLAVTRHWVAVPWLCGGIGVVPAVTTALVVRALVVDRWRRAATGGKC